MPQNFPFFAAPYQKPCIKLHSKNLVAHLQGLFLSLRWQFQFKEKAQQSHLQVVTFFSPPGLATATKCADLLLLKKKKSLISRWLPTKFVSMPACMHQNTHNSHWKPFHLEVGKILLLFPTSHYFSPAIGIVFSHNYFSLWGLASKSIIGQILLQQIH